MKIKKYNMDDQKIIESVENLVKTARIFASFFKMFMIFFHFCIFLLIFFK